MFSGHPPYCCRSCRRWLSAIATTVLFGGVRIHLSYVVWLTGLALAGAFAGFAARDGFMRERPALTALYLDHTVRLGALLSATSISRGVACRHPESTTPQDMYQNGLSVHDCSNVGSSSTTCNRATEGHGFRYTVLPPNTRSAWLLHLSAIPGTMTAAATRLQSPSPPPARPALRFILE